MHEVVTKDAKLQIEAERAQLPDENIQNTTAVPLLQVGGRTLDDVTDRVELAWGPDNALYRCKKKLHRGALVWG